MSISDQMFEGGGMPLLDALHGETITVLSGADEGRSFTAIREIEQDATLNSETGSLDPRAKRMLRFRDSTGVPGLAPQDVIETDDGKKWHAVRNPQSGYLTTDFELIEITAKDT